jgi:hypothetical protein
MRIFSNNADKEEGNFRDIFSALFTRERASKSLIVSIIGKGWIVRKEGEKRK